jgi:oligoribonuclease NrnB/cAMP/cGMP phosphodiesterase (DHH superfamily)
MDLIIHHAKCRDGWCAAYVAKKKYPEAKLVALEYGLDEGNLAAIVSSCSNAEVLMVDYSLPTRQQNDDLATVAKSFRIFDHHKTAQVVLEGASYATFDMARSGAGLTWDILFGNADSQSVLARPWYVDYVEDHDLWNHKLKDTYAINAYIATLPFTIEAWDKLRFMSSNSACDLGSGALAHVKHYVQEIIKDAKTGSLAGCKVAILNAPYLNCSEVGNELAKTHDFSITWYEPGDGIIRFSLRSIGEIDVSRVAKRNGGGGHKNAAGFELPLREGRKLIDQIHNRHGELESSFAGKREPGGCL